MNSPKTKLDVLYEDCVLELGEIINKIETLNKKSSVNSIVITSFISSIFCCSAFIIYLHFFYVGNNDDIKYIELGKRFEQIYLNMSKEEKKEFSSMSN